MVKTNRFFHASKWNWNFIYVCIVTLPLLFVNTLWNFIHLICTLQEFSFDDSEFNHKFARISISSLSTMPFLLRKFCNLYFLVGMLNKVSCKRIMTFTKKSMDFHLYIELVMTNQPIICATDSGSLCYYAGGKYYFLWKLHKWSNLEWWNINCLTAKIRAKWTVFTKYNLEIFVVYENYIGISMQINNDRSIFVDIFSFWSRFMNDFHQSILIRKFDKLSKLPM